MVKITKLQDTGGSLTTTVPSSIREIFNLKKGDSVKWVLDLTSSPPTITLETMNKEQ